MPRALKSNILPTITSSPQQLNLPPISSQPRTAASSSLPQSTSSRRAKPALPIQQGDEHLPNVDPRPLDLDLQGIGVSLKIESEVHSSQIYLRSAGHWKPVGSLTNECELTIVLEVHVSAGADHGRFKSVEIKVQLHDISDKGMRYTPEGLLPADETHVITEKEEAGGGTLGVNAPFASLSGSLSGSSKTTHDYNNRAICKGLMEEGPLVRWTIIENKARGEGILWYSSLWPNPTIKVKVPRDRLRNVTIGYQIICEFEEKKKFLHWFKKTRYQFPEGEREFKWISFNLERSESQDDNLNKIEETT